MKMSKRFVLLTCIVCIFTIVLGNSPVFAERLSSAQLNKKLQEYQKILDVDLTKKSLEVREDDFIEEPKSLTVFYTGPDFEIDLKSGKLRRFDYCAYYEHGRYKLQRLSPITKEQALARAKVIIERLGNKWDDKKIEIRFRSLIEDKNAGIFNITFWRTVGKYKTDRFISLEVFTPGGKIVGYSDNTFEPMAGIGDIIEGIEPISKEEAVKIAKENWLGLRKKLCSESTIGWFKLGKVLHSELRLEELPISPRERREKGLSGKSRLCWRISIERVHKENPELRGWVLFVIDAETEEILYYTETK